MNLRELAIPLVGLQNYDIDIKQLKPKKSLRRLTINGAWSILDLVYLLRTQTNLEVFEIINFHREQDHQTEKDVFIMKTLHDERCELLPEILSRKRANVRLVFEQLPFGRSTWTIFEHQI